MYLRKSVWLRTGKSPRINKIGATRRFIIDGILEDTVTYLLKYSDRQRLPLHNYEEQKKQRKLWKKYIKISAIGPPQPTMYTVYIFLTCSLRILVI